MPIVEELVSTGESLSAEELLAEVDVRGYVTRGGRRVRSYVRGAGRGVRRAGRYAREHPGEVAAAVAGVGASAAGYRSMGPERRAAARGVPGAVVRDVRANVRQESPLAKRRRSERSEDARRAMRSMGERPPLGRGPVHDEGLVQSSRPLRGDREDLQRKRELQDAQRAREKADAYRRSPQGRADAASKEFARAQAERSLAREKVSRRIDGAISDHRQLWRGVFDGGDKVKQRRRELRRIEAHVGQGSDAARVARRKLDHVIAAHERRLKLLASVKDELHAAQRKAKEHGYVPTFEQRNMINHILGTPTPHRRGVDY